MESQNTLAEVGRHNTTNEMNSALLDEALTLLSRLLGREAALDFVRNPDILTEGDAE